ncbi:ketoacyl-ACP synthase III [Bdellovibrio sp. SKB1291214]|uniref:beta-ketoacyl-ACP synthase III n=1 Tax=Bdellovibrio sp. SKB1291214 TaxID=1732569 RepID=UPI000B515359|nr:beta-ketoacyl-ACP synthase III [Bdellovibrio sp. SKB1291214]UYL08152.1 ketoacyl-ACP synthase III [Bdellovibrio sp. SKB1291214]
MAGMYRSRVAGIGSYLPEKILSNFDLEKMVETSDQWIVERTGIERRHIAAEGEGTSDLCLRAAEKALADANLTAQDIDMIIVGTVTGDRQMPSTACYVQSKLGCRNIVAFDLNAACSGFLYSVSIADQFIRTGMYKNVLVLGAEVLSRFVNFKDRETCILFGDGAGAWVLQRAQEGDKNVIASSHLHADGDLAELLTLPGGGSLMPQSQYVLDNNLHYVSMKGREIFKNAVRTMALCCKEALEANEMSPDKVDWIVPHQANKRIVEAVADQFKFPMERVILYLHETGNTSSASIPLAFDWAVQNGKIKRGQTILLTAFGAGLTSGSVLLRY